MKTIKWKHDDEASEDENLRRVLSFTVTEPVPGISNKSIAITWDICHSINRLINPNRSPLKLFFQHADYPYLMRVVHVQPSVHQGFLLVEGRDYLNSTVLMEVGSHCNFDLRFA